MEESSSNYKSNSNPPSDSQESQIIGIPQLANRNSSFTEQQVNKSSGEYVKVYNKNVRIDEEAILNEFNTNQDEEQRAFKNPPKTINKKSLKKPSSTPSKKYEIANLRKRWKAEMDENINKYKQYLTEEKSAYDSKQKQYLLEFYKVLLDGVFELKYHSEDEHNDLTLNEKKVIAPESDYHLYLKTLVDSYAQTFKEAKLNNKIINTKAKWDPLIKNCKDETNFELRRKIIRMKIKPVHVLENNNRFLMSEEAKLEEQRINKLILNEADKNFDRPLEGTDQNHEIEVEQEPEIKDLPEILESFKSMSSYDQADKKITQEKERLEDYRWWIGDEPAIRLKKRMEQTFQGTSCYDKLMQSFTSVFPGV